MPSEDRDRMFEKALARHLGNDRAGASACLDPETLAAYYQQTLPPEQLAAAKEHLVGCARCQEVLVQLEWTQTIAPLGDEDEVPVVAARSARTGGDEVDEQAPLAVSRKAAPRAARQKIVELRSPKSALRWAAPAGAIAAGLLLFIGLREFRSSKPASVATEVAENRNGAARDSEMVPAGPPALQQQKSDAPAGGAYARRAKPSAPAPLRDERQWSEAGAEIQPQSKSGEMAAAKAPLAAPEEGKKEVRRNDPASGMTAGTIADKTESVDANNRIALDSTKMRGVGKEKDLKSQVGTGAGPAPTPTPPPSPALEAARSAQVTDTAAGEFRVQPLSREENERAAYNQAAFNLSALPYSTVAPGGKSVWRFGENGVIAHSKNSGSSWESQVAGVVTALTTGSAPSEKVCWLAGARGTLLRTTDGGKHWQRVTTPIAGDLGGVHASDARHASIWDVANRLSYETSDGGITWKPSTNE
jgi:hypothetical protein